MRSGYGLSMTQTPNEKLVADLADGEEFSLDGGSTWHTCAVVLFGNIAVYTDDRRDPDVANTVRIDGERDQTALVR